MQKQLKGIFEKGSTHWVGDGFHVRNLFPSNGLEDENGPNRHQGIQNNYVRTELPLAKLSPGNHVLKVHAIDPGVVIDRIALPSNH